MSHTRPTRFRYSTVLRPPDPCAMSGSGVPAHDIDRGVNRMSVHPGEFREAQYSIPQDWASLARYLARRGIVLGPAPAVRRRLWESQLFDRDRRRGGGVVPAPGRAAAVRRQRYGARIPHPLL